VTGHDDRRRVDRRAGRRVERRPDDRERRDDGRDRGVSFVELVVSVVILGAASVAVLTALVAATRTAEVRREVHDAHASLSAAGVAISDLRTVYVPCAAPSDPTYRAAIAVPRRIAPDLAPVSIAAIEYWDGDGPGRWSSTCRYDDGYRLQRITLSVAVGDDRRELAVVKRPGAATVELAPPARDRCLGLPDRTGSRRCPGSAPDGISA
jgi:hypothetical protein